LQSQRAKPAFSALGSYRKAKSGTFNVLVGFTSAISLGRNAMTQIRQPERRSRTLRGRPYSLNEFAAKYGLRNEQAESLYTRFGPSSVELDLLMAAKRRPPMLPDRISE
jgi:hypothetical protein